MEISGHHQEEDIPMPINSSFVGVQHAHSHYSLMTHHHHHPHHYDPSSSTSHNQQHNIIPSNNSNGNTSTTANVTNMDDDHHQVQCNINGNGNGNGNKNDDGDDVNDMGTKKKSMMIIKYKECQKNHAASMGGNATDGCGEFMPNGEHGSIESLTCSACKCHRNFHRKEIQGYPTNSGALIPFARSITMSMHDDHHLHHHQGNGIGMMMIKPHPHHHHDHYHHHDHNQMVKKRFRTKFSQEQKEKMLEFAEKVGWKIQKQEEDEVQQICQEIGIKRRVLKVWMHNNKHTLAKHKTNLNNTD
ncbi:zinc-finger homeodomain protein 3-like [Amaranthus tricolor]|uniref:zinc-finger homeodomain protein 3-like n=1 Tax=Amaranthus tricolor TaxID=29722 RepID=UPI00258A7260|nr:zinc-finger homeodomain protein 3-like [Amaranthus tricolor]XP_057542567.1 zinc-finger homeodomain protein 3-like [Amaranthus tricolor]